MTAVARGIDFRTLAETCRVVFDMERLRGNIQSGLDAGEQVTESDVHDWLDALGFTPAADGHAWIGRHRALRHFAEGEVIGVERIT